MERGMLLIPLLLLVLTVLTWVTSPCGATKVIPTVVKKSKNHEGWVCLQVTRGLTTPRPSVRRPASRERQHRRNAKRGLRLRTERINDHLEGRFVTDGLQSQLESPRNVRENDGTAKKYMLRRREIPQSQNALQSEEREQTEKDIREDVLEEKSLKSSKGRENITTSLLNYRKATNSSSEKFAKEGEQLRPLDTQSPMRNLPKDSTKKQLNKLEDDGGIKSLSTLQFPATSSAHEPRDEDIGTPERSSSERTLEDGNEYSNHHHSRSPSSSRKHSLLRPVEDSMAGARRVVKYVRSPLVEVSLHVTSLNDNVQYTVGAAAVDTRLLADGQHTLHFKHVIVHNQHNLRVEVDGHECPFTALSVREYSVGHYYRDEVQVKVQGPVSFVANSPCEDLAVEPGNNITSPPSIRDEGPQEDTQINFPAENQPTETSVSTDLPDLLPTTILSNVVIRDESLVYVIILNSTIYDSDIKLSFINNSRLINTTVITSQVIIANITDSILLNSSLHNVTLENSILGNTRTFNSIFHNTTVYDNSTFDDLPHSSVPPLRATEDLEILDGAEEGKGSVEEQASSGGLNATMMAFGILGLVALGVVMGGVVAVIARHISKKRKEMLLVRSAVMGNVKSW